MSTQFPFLHPLLLYIISSYPFIILFVFELCKMFSPLTAISYHLSAQFCSRPQTLQRKQTLQEQCYFLNVTALERGKWPRYPLKLSCTIRMLYFQLFCFCLFCATNVREHREVWSPQYFFFFKVHHTYSNQLIFLFYFIFIGTELAVAVRNLAVLKNSYFNRH